MADAASMEGDKERVMHMRWPPQSNDHKYFKYQVAFTRFGPLFNFTIHCHLLTAINDQLTTVLAHIVHYNALPHM